MRASDASRGGIFAASRFQLFSSGHRLRACLFAVCALITLAPAAAQETINYTYDARGRLVNVNHGTTGPNAGVTAAYTYDAADNRSQVVVTSAGSGVAFSISNNGAVTEGGTSVFTITKSGTASAPLTVNYATADGTAVAPGDYTATVGTVTFATTDTSKTVSVPTIDDSIVESTETFTMGLSAPSGGATIGTGTATATINDNDVPPPPCSGVSFTIASNGAVTEGASSIFTVAKAGTTSSSCSVNYGTADGTATAGSDYNATSGTLTFTSAQASQTVSVPTIDDTVVESAETFAMSLSSPTSGATLGTPSSATATINDNDTVPTCAGVSYAISDASTVEGSPLTFVVTKSGSASINCSVNYATADGTAVAGTGYTATSGTLTFTPTQTSANINVTTINHNRTAGIIKTMFVNLSSPTSGATITDSQGQGSIDGSASCGRGC